MAPYQKPFVEDAEDEHSAARAGDEVLLINMAAGFSPAAAATAATPSCSVPTTRCPAATTTASNNTPAPTAPAPPPMAGSAPRLRKRKCPWESSQRPLGRGGWAVAGGLVSPVYF